MKILLSILMFISVCFAEQCTYNNINIFGGNEGDSFLLLGQYGNNPIRCKTNRIILSKYIESFSINNQTDEVTLFMLSGERFKLVNCNISFQEILKITKYNK